MFRFCLAFAVSVVTGLFVGSVVLVVPVVPVVSTVYFVIASFFTCCFNCLG